MTTDTHSSQAGLASFRGHMPPTRITIYAAVIEWPSWMSDADPALILARSESERDKQIAEEIAETARALAEPDWRDAINANSNAEGGNWRDWLDPLDATSYGQPFVTTYEMEV